MAEKGLAEARILRAAAIELPDLVAHRQLCGSESRHRHPERRTGHVGKSRIAAECNRFGIAAMFAADRQDNVGIGRATALCPDAQQLSDAIDIEAVEWVFGIDALLHVVGHEPPGVVAREA